MVLLFSLISGGPRRVTGTVEFLLWGNHFPIVILMEIGVSPHYISIWAIDSYQPPLYLF
jgi:hypothetical protein